MNLNLFQTIPLNETHEIFISYPIDSFLLKNEAFKEIWNLHPEEFHSLLMHGKEVLTPRWQQAYGKSYRYTGSKNNALPIPIILQPFLIWSQQHIDSRLNGLLLNWYDGHKDHYIGAHRDDTRDLVKDSPIVTISLGQERIFRMRPFKKRGYKDITFRNGEVIVMPSDTNQNWTHEVPKFKKFDGKRISITLRAFL